MDYVALIASLIEPLLGIASKAIPGQASSIIAIIEKLVPVAVETEQSLLPLLQGLIDATRSNVVMTNEELDALEAQSNAVNAALDAAAKDDGII